MTTTPKLGSVSHGTMNPEHLIPTFTALLREHNPAKADELRTGAYADVYDIMESDTRDPIDRATELNLAESQDWLLYDLFEALDSLAPDGYYFGAHPGDGSDYGFWEQDPQSLYADDHSGDTAEGVEPARMSPTEQMRSDQAPVIPIGTERDFWPINASQGAYEPWTDGYVIGFKYRTHDGREQFIYLNPSSDADDGIDNVFVYQGRYGDPAYDTAVHHYLVLTPEEE